MKKIISLLTAAASAASLMVPVQAKEEITADKVAEMLYVHSIANSDEYDEIMSYDYFDYYNDEINTDIKLSELGDPSKSFREFHIAGPNEFNTYYDYEEGDILSVFEETDAEGSDQYYLETADGQYIQVTIQEETGYYTPDPVDGLGFDKAAAAINAAELSGVSDIRFCSGFYYVKANEGEYAIPTHGDVNERRNNESITEWAAMPLGEYLEFETNVAMDEYNARTLFEERLASVKLPEEYVYAGDTPRETTYFADYAYSQNPFSDTDGTTAKAAALLYDMGVTNGCGDGKYEPDLSMTVGQAGTMLERLMKNGAAYTEEYNDTDILTAVSAADLLLRLTGKSYIPASEDRIFAYAGWMLDGIESFDVTATVTRGEFAIMLCNALDQPLNVAQAGPANGYGINSISYTADITLIDYINGKKPNGAYLTSPSAEKEWTDNYFTWLYTTCGDWFYEYYGDTPWIVDSMEEYGWTKPE